MGFFDILQMLDPDGENNPVQKLKSALVDGIDSIDNALNSSADVLESRLSDVEKAADGLRDNGKKLTDTIDRANDKLAM